MDACENATPDGINASLSAEKRRFSTAVDNYNALTTLVALLRSDLSAVNAQVREDAALFSTQDESFEGEQRSLLDEVTSEVAAVREAVVMRLLALQEPFGERLATQAAERLESLAVEAFGVGAVSQDVQLQFENICSAILDHAALNSSQKKRVQTAADMFARTVENLPKRIPVRKEVP